MAAAIYAPGDFTFMPNEMYRDMFSDMYRAVTVTKNWNNLKRYVPKDGGFTYGDRPDWLEQINSAMQYDGHSGSSYGATMRHIDYIAKHGWEDFMLKMTPGAIDGATRDRLRIAELPYAIEEAQNELDGWKTRNEQVDLTSEHAAETKSNMAKLIHESTVKVASLESELAVLMSCN
jgi:hypothetical protein